MENPLDLIEYEKMLIDAKKIGYKFITFNKDFLLNNLSRDRGRLIIRHDIDVCPKAAYEMAKIEFLNQIKSTYFFMIRSPLYNLFSRENFFYVSEIIKFGHQIGLHYDAGFYNEADYEKYVFKEIIKHKEILEEEFNISIRSVSFHQPSKKILKADFQFPEDLVNTYSKEINLEYKYFSDTNQKIRWIEDKNISVKNSLSIKYPENLQLLIHPIWWVYNRENPKSTWTNALQNIFEESQKQLVETERVFGKRRIIKLIENE